MQRFIDKVTITLYLTPGSTEAGNTINYYFVKRIQDIVIILTQQMCRIDLFLVWYLDYRFI